MTSHEQNDDILNFLASLGLHISQHSDRQGWGFRWASHDGWVGPYPSMMVAISGAFQFAIGRMAAHRLCPLATEPSLWLYDGENWSRADETVGQ